MDKPRLAVVVQKQIAAETAGVAFSLNPVNNCYDEEELKYKIAAENDFEIEGVHLDLTGLSTGCREGR